MNFINSGITLKLLGLAHYEITGALMTIKMRNTCLFACSQYSFQINQLLRCILRFVPKNIPQIYYKNFFSVQVGALPRTQTPKKKRQERSLEQKKKKEEVSQAKISLSGIDSKAQSRQRGRLARLQLEEWWQRRCRPIGFYCRQEQ